MKAEEKSTAGAKPASPQQIRTALEAFLKATDVDEKRDAFGKMITGVASRLPKPPATATETKPDPSNLPIPPDQHQRAVAYMDQVYYGLDAIIDIASDYTPENPAKALLAIEYVAERCKRLLGAACTTLESFDIADDDELGEESKRYRRRREGKPECATQDEASA